MYEALGKARDMFKLYAELHRAKGTVDSDAKAKVNEDMVAIMNEALSVHPDVLPELPVSEAFSLTRSVYTADDMYAYARAAIASRDAEIAKLRQPEPSAEDRAEAFIQAAISNAPDPLRKLGEFLTRVLDEDQWPTAERFLLAIAAQPTQAEPVLPNNEHVICPGCAHQFRAIPVQVQQLLLSAGHEPPFLAAQPPREPVQPLSDEDMADCGLLSELRLEEELRAEWNAEMRRDAFGDKT